METIQQRLFALQDVAYGDFHSRLMPGIARALIIGVRTPALRTLAKELRDSAAAESFMEALPHEYYEEDNLHASLICFIKDFEPCLTELERLLPWVDNWATCDMLRPKALKKNREKLLERVLVWLCSEHTYTVRFAIGMLMDHFLDENFRPEYMDLVAGVNREEYYIRMMQAWYFATALYKQYDQAVKYLEEKSLSPWVHNKTIQKARESYRVSDEQKEYLKSLKIKR